MDGIINIYKEAGYTSADVVAKLRGILRQKKIGHTGTLDPAAEGVLPICLGKGTKLVDMLTEEKKTYRAVLLLGRETDTQDTTGTTVHETDFTAFLGESGQTAEAFARNLAETAAGFVGDYMQVPPMYSALKVNGKRLYELARKGIEVERKPRLQHIYRIDIDRVDLPRAELTVECSRGTYIRTLCHDIGQKLGCGGCMEHLLRTQVGPFLLESSGTRTGSRRFWCLRTGFFPDFRSFIPNPGSWTGFWETETPLTESSFCRRRQALRQPMVLRTAGLWRKCLSASMTAQDALWASTGMTQRRSAGKQKRSFFRQRLSSMET